MGCGSAATSLFIIVSEPSTNRFSLNSKISSALDPDEQLLERFASVPIASARATVRGFGLAGGLGAALARAGAVKGEPGSVARQIPTARNCYLVVTQRRVGLVKPGLPGKMLWSAARSEIIRVERRPRLQALARFRLHFADGSSAAFMTWRRRNIDRLAESVVNQND